MGAYEEFVIAGDVDATGTVDIADAIRSFQVCVGMILSSSLCIEADVSGDGKIGLEEAIYALKTAADVISE